MITRIKDSLELPSGCTDNIVCCDVLSSIWCGIKVSVNPSRSLAPRLFCFYRERIR